VHSLKYIYRNNKRNSYTEEFDEGYTYDVDEIIDNQLVSIFILKEAVSIIRNDGIIRTNIIPIRLFGDQERLHPYQIKHVLDLLENIGYEGKHYTFDEFDQFMHKDREEFCE
jgi:hypothetical protein